ncbi:hypothetical protein DBR06_SOUSAS1810067, partial [Sousa chinensis]
KPCTCGECRKAFRHRPHVTVHQRIYSVKK